VGVNGFHKFPQINCIKIHIFLEDIRLIIFLKMQISIEAIDSLNILAVRKVFVSPLDLFIYKFCVLCLIPENHLALSSQE